MRYLNVSGILGLAQQGKIYLLSANPGAFWNLLLVSASESVFIFLSLGFFSLLGFFFPLILHFFPPSPPHPASSHLSSSS